MVKFSILLKRKASLSHDEFVKYHKTKHAPLFMSTAIVQKTVRRYVQQHAIPVELPGLPPVKYDGITELWFDDINALTHCFSDVEYLSKIRPDEEKFLDLGACDFIVSAETVIAKQAFAGHWCPAKHTAFPLKFLTDNLKGPQSIQNGPIESFTARMGDEQLNKTLFCTIPKPLSIPRTASITTKPS